MLFEKHPDRVPHTVGAERYLEDLQVGEVYRTGRVTVDAAAIKAFAAAFDPQPFHLDEIAAKDTLFQGLAASGWHTAALTMRLLVQSGVRPAGGFIGAGFTDFRWPRPVRPGDELSVEWEVLDLRRSRKNPGQGLLNVRVTALNQNGEAVLVQVGTLVIRCRTNGTEPGQSKAS